MYKMMINFSIISIMLLIFLGCSEHSDTSPPLTIDQIVIEVIDQIGFDFKQSDDYYIQGRVVGEPVPDFNYMKINTNLYEIEDNYSYYLGCLFFKLTNEQLNTLEMTDTVTMEVSTSLGSVTGVISKPSQLDSVMINDTSSDYNYQIENDQDIILTWTYGDIKPDFVHILYWYDWFDEITQEYVGDFVLRTIPNTENSIKLFDADETNMNGEIYVNFSSYNGPVLESNTLGNMTGEGSGYLYRRLITDAGIFGIQVGAGLKNKAMTEDELIEIGHQEFKKYIMGQLGMEN